MANREPKPRLSISFSGGRTSAYMTKLLLDEYKDSYDISVTFANTGCEHEGTLEFIHKCDTRFGFPTVWLEAVVNPEKGKGTTHRIVNYETASRNGEPFEAVIKKYGVPNGGCPGRCTEDTKWQPMKSYLRSIGWGPGSYQTAIGIRADEPDRISSQKERYNLIYPLIKAGVDKAMVHAWWRAQAFDLKIPEHYGNCVTCWKKSKRKLLTVAQEIPDAFEFFDRMEKTYGNVGTREGDPPRTFFRNHQSAQDILAEAKRGGFVPYSEGGPQLGLFDEAMDIGGGCGDSCEIGADYEFDGGTLEGGER